MTNVSWNSPTRSDWTISSIAAYWSVPGQEQPQNKVLGPFTGSSVTAQTSTDNNGMLPLIAEDLGVVTPDVEELHDQFHLHGMKVYNSPLMATVRIHTYQKISLESAGWSTQEPTTIQQHWDGGRTAIKNTEKEWRRLMETSIAPGGIYWTWRWQHRPTMVPHCGFNASG